MPAFVRLLGLPAVRYEGRWLELPAGKRSAILCYLAHAQDWVSRDDLLYLFWPDAAESQARQILRPLLSKLRRLEYLADLESDKKRLRWRPDTDVQALREAVAEKNWPHAWRTYSEGLLAGFRAPGLREFESWLELEREALHKVWREAALAYASDLEHGGRFADAAEVLARLHRNDALDEEVFRRYLAALFGAGRRTEALQAYASFSGLLRQELDCEPEPATQQLIDGIRHHQVPTPGVAAAKTVPDAIKRLSQPLKAQATPFIGRQHEKATIHEQLKEPTCRLLTICGPGGIGKTRLALAAASEQQPLFADGVAFVTFEDITGAEFMLAKLAGALGLTFYGSQDPKQQLLSYLRDKELLVVLDNLEHLLDGTSLIAHMLASASGIKIIATSRERLDLRSEWVFDLGGLGYPAPPSMHSVGAHSGGPTRKDGSEPAHAFDPVEHDAVRLFMHAARQARTDFVPDERRLEAIYRICQLVEGLPLAIELAASWLRLLSVEEIAAQLATGIDLLETAAEDMPERHRNLRAVFEGSWSLLRPREQEALRKLAVFSGGFTLEAADVVTQATLPVLLALVNKSFLRRSASGRYTGHPVAWQFARERLTGNLAEHREVQSAHASYYLEFVEAAAARLSGSEQGAALASLEAEHDNLRAALQWALADKEAALRLRLVAGAWRFWYMHGHHREGLSWLTKALDAPGPNLPTLERANALHGAAVLAFEQGDYASAHALFLDGIVMRRALGDLDGVAASLDQFGVMARLQGDYPLAYSLFGRCLRIRRSLGDRTGLASPIYNLGNVAYDQGDLHLAHILFKESLGIWRELGDRHGIALALSSLGCVLRVRRDYGKARSLHLEGLKIREELQDPFGIAWSVYDLGRLALVEGDYASAAELIEESLRIRLGLGDQHGIAWSHEGLGQVGLDQADFSFSRSHFETSLNIARELGSRRCMSRSLCGLGISELHTGDLASARRRLQEALTSLTQVTPKPKIFETLGDDECDIGGPLTLPGYGALAQPSGFGDKRVIASVFEALAALELAKRDLVRAARLAAAAECLRQAIEAPMPGGQGDRYGRLLAQLRAAMDETTFSAAWEAGRSLSVQEALAFAQAESHAGSTSVARL